MEPDDLLCSRNARPQKALVGRAQWKDQSAPIPEEKTSELGGPLKDAVPSLQANCRPSPISAVARRSGQLVTTPHAHIRLDRAFARK